MDTVILRALEVSDQAVPLLLRQRHALPVVDIVAEETAPDMTVATEPRGDVSFGAIDIGLHYRPAEGHSMQGASPGEITQAIPSVQVPDESWLEAERARIEEELRYEFEARVDAALIDARHRGREEGLELAKAEAARMLEQQRATVMQAIAGIAEHAQKEIAGAEDLIVGIAFEAVCKLLARELISREAVAAMVRQVLSRLKQEESVVVRLHPRDYAVVREQGGVDSIVDAGPMTVELVPDDGISLGGCVVETSGGDLDARIETQLQRLREALLSARQGARSESGG